MESDIIRDLRLTGCCDESLSILKTCATLPLARRCILKLGMAQRVARLIILRRTHKNDMGQMVSLPPSSFTI